MVIFCDLMIFRFVSDVAIRIVVVRIILIMIVLIGIIWAYGLYQQHKQQMSHKTEYDRTRKEVIIKDDDMVSPKVAIQREVSDSLCDFSV